jgi:hypothetical protein
MRTTRVGLFVVCLLIATIPAAAQKSASSQAAQRDPQAVTLLLQSLASVGGATSLSAIQDFTASGTITYYWADAPVRGSVEVRSKGTDELRLDASLPVGVYSWLVNDGSGFSKSPEGNITAIPAHNGRNLSSFLFPYPKMLALLNDSQQSIAMIGVVELALQQASGVRVRQSSGPKGDRSGLVAQISQIDFIIDPATNLVLEVRVLSFPPYDAARGVEHIIQYSDYRAENGILIPHSISEFVGGQQTSALVIDQIKFNTGLSDSEFQF